MIRIKLASCGLLIVLLSAAAPTAAAAATVEVGVDNTAGNEIAWGTVARSDPADALLEVTNKYHFWVAVEVSSQSAASLRPANLLDDFGGFFAAGGLIDPSGTAAWSGTFEPGGGGLATIRVHYDLTSAGGSAAVAANILTIICDSLGVSVSPASPSGLVKALEILMDIPAFVDVAQAAQHQDLWGFVTSMELLLQSQTGRASILEGLREVGVTAKESQLIKVASVVGLIDWFWTLKDLMTAAWQGHTDGSVTFYVSSARPSLSPTPSPTPSPTVKIDPPPAPTSVTATISCLTTYSCPESYYPVVLKWKAPANSADGYNIYYTPGSVDWCHGAKWKATGPTQIVAHVGPAVRSWKGRLDASIEFGKYTVKAWNAGGESRPAQSSWVGGIDYVICE